jgi:hypothetical protein
VTYLQKLGTRLVAAVIVSLVLGTQQADIAAQAQAPADVRALLEGTGDRREYDDRTFSYMPNGRLLRKYRKVR